MMSTNAMIVLFLTFVLLLSNLSVAMAQNSVVSQNLLVTLKLVPSHIDSKNTAHSIGYINLVNKNGIAVKAPHDIVVKLQSDDPKIASIPEEVVIPSGQNYAKFDVMTGTINGETTISSQFNNKIDYKTIKVGGIQSFLPDDIQVKLNIPTHNMHVNSEMPFSVFLQTSEGKVIRAPYDIQIALDYEDSLISSNVDELVIKEGNYYAWGIVKTNKDVGNAYLRATYQQFDLHTSENIEITSSLPVGLKIDVFPTKVGALVERQVELFVSLVDSEGNPAVTPEPVQYELFSDNQVVSKRLDEIMKTKKLEIKKSQFGHHVKVDKLDLSSLVNEDITIGTTASDYGIALGKIDAVASLSIDNSQAIKKGLKLYIPNKIPANTTSILVYQLSAMGNLDREIVEFACNPKTDECGEETVQIEVKHPIDLVSEEEFYPMQGQENYIAEGLAEKLNVISSDNSLIRIDSQGEIKSTNSYGVASISSGEKTGSAELVATIKEFGAGVNSTEIIDVYRHVETKIFSPTGEKVVLDKNGFFDIFLIALDGQERPKILEKETRYLLTPINEVLPIQKERAFAYSNFHSDSFNAGLEERIEVEAVPVGIKADLGLEASTEFESQISSLTEITLPFDNIDANSETAYEGVVQIKDTLGYPTKASKEIKIKLDLEGTQIATIPEQVTINEGESYTTFMIMPNGDDGDAMISASVKGVLGSDTKISTRSNLPELKIFADGVPTPLNIGEPVELKIFVDDENAESVPGASVRFVTNGEAEITPDDTRTNNDGSTTVDLVANEGPSVSIQIIATAEGYSEGKQTFDYQVMTGGSAFGDLTLGLPDWIIYVGLAAVVGIISVLVVFLKKPKPIDEDEYEYEDEI